MPAEDHAPNRLPRAEPGKRFAGDPLLIAGGADVNAKSTKGVTPLMIAAAHDNPPLIGLLIQAGADVNAKTPDGKTALDIAKSNQNTAAIQQIELLARQDKRKGAMMEVPPAETSEPDTGSN